MNYSQTIQPATAGIIAALVGFSSSFAVILKGLSAVGASNAQAASGLMAVTFAMGLAGIIMSLWTRMPISAAWSTPGAALLASGGAAAGGFPAAVGAFICVGALIVAAGLFRPFGRLVAAIPPPLASAMLAGILFALCLNPVKALVQTPMQAAPVILVWLAVAHWRRVFATPAAALVAGFIIALSSDGGGAALAHLAPQPIFTTPQFNLAALTSIAVPLFIVTMASQNLPGLAVLAAFGYRPAPGPLLSLTGVFTLLSAPFGAHAVNLSAITAAMTAAPDASPDPARRWIATLATGSTYVALGLLASAVTSFVAGSPALVEAVAGLALLSAFGGALHNALLYPPSREAALITFLTAASGVSFFGVGSAFWGLLAGGAVWLLSRPTTPAL